MTTKITFESALLYNLRHGGAWDRGSADSYYQRSFDPHCYVGDTATSTRVEAADMTAEDIEAYTAGYEWNERFGHKKNYG
jgi:hypothetical protein